MATFTEYLIKYRFINTGTQAHSVVRLPPGEKRDIRAFLEDHWKGLLCTSGGLRNVLEITKLV